MRNANDSLSTLGMHRGDKRNDFSLNTWGDFSSFLYGNVPQLDLCVTFLYRKVISFLLRFWVMGKTVFVEGRMKYSTVVLILIKTIKKWVNLDGF